MIAPLIALTLTGGALAIAGYEIARHLRRRPANDVDVPRLSARLRTRMRAAALMLGAALALLLFDFL